MDNGENLLVYTIKVRYKNLFLSAEEELPSQTYKSFSDALLKSPIHFGKQDIVAMPSDFFGNINDYIYKSDSTKGCEGTFDGSFSLETETLTLANIAANHYDDLCDDLLSKCQKEVAELNSLKNLTSSDEKKVLAQISSYNSQIIPLEKFSDTTNKVYNSSQSLIDGFKL